MGTRPPNRSGNARWPAVTANPLAFLLAMAISLSLVAATSDAAHGTGGRTRLSAAELKIWNSPEFKKRFTEGYLAETEIEPTVTQSERDRMMDVLELIQGDNLDEAAKLLQKHTKPASSAVFDFTLARIHFQQDQLDLAAAACQRAVTKFPKFRRAWKNLGLIYMRSDQPVQALPALTRAVELGDNEALTYGFLGYAHLSADDNVAAESAYRMAVLLDSRTLDWKMGLARSLFMQKRFADAAALCEDMIAKDPNQADIWLLQANAYIRLGEPLKAAVNYELVDRMGKSTAESLNTLGDIYVNQELFEIAVDSYLRAFEKDPKDTVSRAIDAAKVLTSRRAFDQTKRLIARVEPAVDPEVDKEQRKDLLKLRARIAVAEASGEDEIKVLEEIVALDPLDGEALILLAQYCGRAGDYEKAIFYCERAEGIEKYEAEARLRHAQLLVEQRKYSEALPLLRRAQDLKPREDVRKFLEQVERVAKSR